MPNDDENAGRIAVSFRRGSLIAAAGCGKTEQIAQATAISDCKRLILTHTHAGVCVGQNETFAVRDRCGLRDLFCLAAPCGCDERAAAKADSYPARVFVVVRHRSSHVIASAMWRAEFGKSLLGMGQ